MGLAGEDHLERPFRVPQHPAQAVHIGEQQTGPLVGREPAGETDRHDRGIERRFDLCEDRWRLPMAGELAAQPTMDEQAEFAFLAHVGFPQVGPGDLLQPVPERVLARAGVKRLEIGVEVASEQLDDR